MEWLTSAHEYNVVCFAAGSFYLWIHGNLGKSVSENDKRSNIFH